MVSRAGGSSSPEPDVFNKILRIVFKKTAVHHSGAPLSAILIFLPVPFFCRAGCQIQYVQFALVELFIEQIVRGKV